MVIYIYIIIDHINILIILQKMHVFLKYVIIHRYLAQMKIEYMCIGIIQLLS